MTLAPAVFTTALVLSLILTRLAERAATAWGVVARPREDRWSRQTVPLLGGVPIVVVTVGVTLGMAPAHRNLLVLVAAAMVMGAVGLADDVRRLSPQVKVLTQLLLAGALLYFGLALRLTGYPFVDAFLTLFWVVAVTNAFNLLDNMDGLAATIAMVAVAFRLLFFYWERDTTGVLVTAGFLGAIGGFLVRNFPPARIFMGDAGSMFLGFFLAGLSLVATQAAYSRGIAAVLVIPVLLVSIPMFDTAFVTVTRLLSGRRVDIGGRDHTSHRLVAIGLTERQTLLVLGTISAVAGGVAVLSYRAGLSYGVVLLALLALGLLLLGVHLNRVRVLQDVTHRPEGTVLRLLADFRYKRQVATLLLDASLIPLAYYAACVIRFESDLPRYLGEFYRSLPIVLVTQLAALASFGLYRGVWRYTSIPDLLRIGKASALGTMASVVVLVYTERFVGFSRTVFILDWLLLLVLIGGSRVSFRFFAAMLRADSSSSSRVLIYGAGGGGELVVRELLNNPAFGRAPIGFVDDDRSKHWTRIHGLPVFGGGDQIESLIRQYGINEVIVSSSRIQGNGLAVATAACDRLAVPVRRAALRLE